MKKQIIAFASAVGLFFAWLGTGVLVPKAELSSFPAKHAVQKASASAPGDDSIFRKWSQEAQEFDAAVREIEGILRLDLDTPEGAERAEKIMERNAERLHFAKAKMAAAALKVPAFRKGVGEKAGKYGGHREFAEAFKKDPSIIKDVPGLREAAAEMTGAIQPAAAVLKKVGTVLDEAAKKRRGGERSSMRLSLPAGNNLFLNAAYAPPGACGLGPENPGPLRDNICRDLGLTSVPASACDVIRDLVLAFVDVIETKVNCVNRCLSRALAADRSCRRMANQIPDLWLRDAAKLACISVWAADASVCILVRCV